MGEVRGMGGGLRNDGDSDPGGGSGARGGWTEEVFRTWRQQAVGMGWSWSEGGKSPGDSQVGQLSRRGATATLYQVTSPCTFVSVKQGPWVFQGPSRYFLMPQKPLEL